MENKKGVTPEELYNFAVKMGIEKKPIYVNYCCSDDYYSLDEETIDTYWFDGKKLTIELF
jgi:hypothetical protein